MLRQGGASVYGSAAAPDRLPPHAATQARVADAAGIQFRVLNASKGPAVRGPRAQMDRALYKRHMQASSSPLRAAARTRAAAAARTRAAASPLPSRCHSPVASPALPASGAHAPCFRLQEAMRSVPGMEIHDGAVVDLILDDRPAPGGAAASQEHGAPGVPAAPAVAGVVLASGERVACRAVVITTGTFLRGVIHVGSSSRPAGRIASLVSESIASGNSGGDAAADMGGADEVAAGAATQLARRFAAAGFRMGRLKTGTPPRLDGALPLLPGCAQQPGCCAGQLAGQESLRSNTKYQPAPAWCCWRRADDRLLCLCGAACGRGAGALFLPKRHQPGVVAPCAPGVVLWDPDDQRNRVVGQRVRRVGPRGALRQRPDRRPGALRCSHAGVGRTQWEIEPAWLTAWRVLQGCCELPAVRHAHRSAAKIHAPLMPPPPPAACHVLRTRSFRRAAR
jgi:hypothetical protein